MVVKNILDLTRRVNSTNVRDERGVGDDELVGVGLVENGDFAFHVLGLFECIIGIKLEIVLFDVFNQSVEVLLIKFTRDELTFFTDDGDNARTASGERF